MVCFSSTLSFGQCVNLYVKKHFSGDPICRLSPGSKLEICLDNNTVSGGACDFYILKVRDTYNGMSIDLALDNVSWAPKYAELMINYKTQNFGFVIGNNSGAYSFLNEADMEKIREEENVERERQEKQRRDEENRKVDADKNEYLKIDNLVNEKKYKEAYLLVNKLYSPSNYPNSTLIESALLDMDKTLYNSINESAKNSNYLQAFQAFDLLNFKDKYVFDLNDWSNIQEDLLITEYKKRKVKNLMFFVKKFLSDKYKEYTEEISNEDIIQIIKNNQSTLNKLNSGSYELKITSAGNLLIDNKDSSKDYSYPKYMKIFHNEFEISVNGTFTLNIMDSIKNVLKNELSNTDKKYIQWSVNSIYNNSILLVKIKMDGENINYIDNDQYFYSDKSKSTLKSFLGEKFQIIEENKSEEINYKSDLSSDKIQCSFLKKKIRFINGIETSNTFGYYDSKELDLKKKSLVKEKTSVAAIVTGFYGGLIGGGGWLLLRLSEWVSANDGSTVN